MRNQRVLKIIIAVILLFIFPLTSSAHSGRTDSSGGHRDNQNQSGLGYYHYHCGGNPPHLHPNGVCPYSSGYSPRKVKIKRPSRVKKLRVVNQGYTSVKLKWRKVKKSNGYQIYRATKKNERYRLVKTIKKRSRTTFTDRRLKANKTYYYKVRAYKSANRKKYKGKFSIKTKAKTKPALYVPTDIVTIQDSGKIKVTFKVNDTVYFDIDNYYFYDYENIVSCSWSRKWNGDSTYLYLTGNKDGITYITITNGHNNEKKRIKVIVKNRAYLSDTNIVVDQGLTETLDINNSASGVRWKSSNPDIAQVSQYDFFTVITGVSKGTATVTATSPSGSVYHCKVTVK